MTYIHELKERANKYKHLTAHEAATLASMANAKRLIITHFSQRYEHKGKHLEKIAKKIFPNTQVTKDFMRVEI